MGRVVLMAMACFRWVERWDEGHVIDAGAGGGLRERSKLMDIGPERQGTPQVGDNHHVRRGILVRTANIGYVSTWRTLQYLSVY